MIALSVFKKGPLSFAASVFITEPTFKPVLGAYFGLPSTPRLDVPCSWFFVLLASLVLLVFVVLDQN